MANPRMRNKDTTCAHGTSVRKCECRRTPNPILALTIDASKKEMGLGLAASDTAACDKNP